MQSDFSPTVIKDVLLLSPGRWNNVDYTDHEILKAFNATDWNDKKNRMLYLDHQDTKERGVANFGGFVQNVRLLGTSLFGDLEVWNPMVAVWLSKAKAKFGISATLAGRENRQLQKMEDFHFQSFSVVTDPACKPAMINLSSTEKDGDIQTVITLNETKEELESVKHKERREESESVADKKDFCGALKEMLMDEKKAPGAYENLKSLTDNEEVKKQIDGIIADEKRHHSILEAIQIAKENKELAEIETLASEEVKNFVANEEWKQLDAIFERQVSHIKDSLKHSHPEWSEKKREQVAYATANKMKKVDEKKNSDRIDPATKSLSELPRAGDVTEVVTKQLACDISHKGETTDTKLLKGGIKMPEIIENKSEVVAELAQPVKVVDAVPKIEGPGIHDTNVDGHSIFIKQEGKKLSDEAKEDKEEPKSEKKKEEPKKKDEDKEEMSSEAILNKVKEMSSEELVNYTNFVREYLSANVNASAKEVTLAYMKSKADKDKKKELSAAELLSSIDQRIASLKELDSSKKMLELESKVKELSAKVKTPDRKTLSVAFDEHKDANFGMLSFLQNRMN
jgi:rubrerythrin